MLTPIRIRAGAALDFVYRDPDQGISAQVDCRLLFMGAHWFEVRRAYAAAIRIFEAGYARTELLRRLAETPEIQRCYESRENDGKIAITMRDEVFRAPGPLEGIEFSFRVTHRMRTHLYPLALERFAALGSLLPLLEGGRGEDEIREKLAERLSGDDCAWAYELLEWLKRESLIEADSGDSRKWLGLARPRITFLGHSTLLMQARRSTVLVDPIVTRKMGSPKAALEVFKTRLHAICCTHSHWDHCNPETLIRLDKDVPILIPKVSRPTALNPPMVPMLRRLGFTDIREVSVWEPVTIGDIEIVPAPFYGEADEPGAEIDHFTYVMRTNGLTVYGGVDSYRDQFGDMRSVLERAEREYHPDVVFLPVSRVVYTYRDGSLNQFCRYVDEALVPASFQYTAGPEEAAQWSQSMSAGLIVPYATFGFTRWADRAQVMRFGAEMKDLGAGDRFFPLRPLDSIGLPDLLRTPRSRARRRMLLGWHHGISGLRRVGQISGFFRACEGVLRGLRGAKRYLARSFGPRGAPAHN
ncbi:MAG TPA: MBL fold metallo-hydrolase [Candidatus Binataceae bacterium]|nr:MBL fold metallo-hydrolase [Candidatus Binataceae bacterium]